MKTIRSSCTRARWLPLLFCLLIGSLGGAAVAQAADRPRVQVSPRDSRYFELTDGTPWIPIGLNMIAPPGNDMAAMERWMANLSTNGGNFIRIWLSNPYFDVEHQRSGQYDETKAQRIRHLLNVADRHGVRVKLCIEHFRHLGDGQQTWAAKPLHLVTNGGTATNIADFFNGAASREQFKKKLAWFHKQIGEPSAVFGWELWNEINAVQGGDYMAWSERMLPELHRIFPQTLAMQSLGSFDDQNAARLYTRLATMPGNDVAQVHRYLDLGARLEVCHGPMDLLVADAVRTLLSHKPGRPVILAEGGAVEPRHTGPFKLYAEDKAGVLLHDVLFAGFFAGGAGPGHIWHWDHYVAKNDLWWHFSRFAEVVKAIDPPEEHFQPRILDHPQLRIYALNGKRTTLLWCRDKANTWDAELGQKIAPQTLSGEVLDLGSVLRGTSVEMKVYDPWKNLWRTVEATGGKLKLPNFQRSIAVRVMH